MDLDWLEDYQSHRDTVNRAIRSTDNDGYNNAVYDALKWFNGLKPEQKGDVFLYMAGELWIR